MGFRIVKNPRAWRAVQWNDVAEDGSIVTNQILAHFERVDAETFVALFGPRSFDTAADKTAHDAKIFARVVRGWRDFEGPDGLAAEFSAVNIADLLAEPLFPAGLELAYIDYWRALPEQRLGNSEPSPDGGLATAAGMIAAMPGTASS